MGGGGIFVAFLSRNLKKKRQKLDNHFQREKLGNYISESFIEKERIKA
jgi:hypothetical protein